MSDSKKVPGLTYQEAIRHVLETRQPVRRAPWPDGECIRSSNLSFMREITDRNGSRSIKDTVTNVDGVSDFDMRQDDWMVVRPVSDLEQSKIDHGPSGYVHLTPGVRGADVLAAKNVIEKNYRLPNDFIEYESANALVLMLIKRHGFLALSDFGIVELAKLHEKLSENHRKGGRS